MRRSGGPAPRCSELPDWLVVITFILCLPMDSVQLWPFLWSSRTGSYMWTRPALISVSAVSLSGKRLLFYAIDVI